MEDWTSGYVTANRVRLHCTRTGGDKPPLVLAHGVTDDGLCWSPVAEALAAEYDVIMVDARGHGRSEATEGGYDPATQAADLAGLIAALGLRRPAVLGHSMGAATALILAGAYPEVPGAILLEDPPPWWMPDRGAATAANRAAEGKARAEEERQLTREELIAAIRERHPHWSGAEVAPWAESKLRFSPNALTVYGADNPRGIDWEGTLSRITCPVLLIVADPEQGGIVNATEAEALRTIVPRLEVAHVPGAGHSIRRDQFAPYLAAVREFLGRHPAAVGSSHERTVPGEKMQ